MSLASMRIARRCVVALVTLACVLFTVAAPASHEDEPARGTATPAQLVERIRSDEARHMFFDMHGNASGDLQALMVQRFAATKTVMRAIDRMREDASLEPVRKALLRVLGFVKDPASIDWLRALRRADAQRFYGDYVPWWTDRFDGYGSWKWLTGREPWIAFWIAAFDDERSPERRIDLLNVLDQFDDASVVAFFQKRRIEATEPKEILLVESYLDMHDVPADGERVTKAIAALRDTPGNVEFLVTSARRLRHEAFLPFLVDHADWTHPNYSPPSYEAQRALQEITLACHREGALVWRFWFLVHGREGRDAWRRSAIEPFRAQLASNRADAAKRFETLVFCWHDIALLDVAQNELAPYPEFHDSLVGWLNRTYTHHYHERLRPLAMRIASSDLPGWSQDSLRRRGYLPDPEKITWAETVRRDNMRL